MTHDEIFAKPGDQLAQEMSYRFGGWTFYFKITAEAYKALRQAAQDEIIKEFDAGGHAVDFGRHITEMSRTGQLKIT